MKLAIIVAVANNGVIGVNNRLPWHLPQDLKYFKVQTLGKPIIMGRKTYESIGRPLPGRINIVVTRSADWVAPEGVLVAHEFGEAQKLAENVLISLVNQADEAMVIGGSELYTAALPCADRVYLTAINADIDGDAFFPELDPNVWCLSAEKSGDHDAQYAHRFLTYERIIR